MLLTPRYQFIMHRAVALARRARSLHSSAASLAKKSKKNESDDKKLRKEISECIRSGGSLPSLEEVRKYPWLLSRA